MPCKRCHNDMFGIAIYSVLFKLLLILILIHSSFCDSDDTEYAQSAGDKKQDDLADLDVFQENAILPELILKGNQLYEEEASLNVEEEGATRNEDYLLPTSESVTLESDVKPQENGTVVEGNITLANATSGNENKTSVKVECLLGELQVGEIPAVQLINGTMLIKIFSAPANNSTAGECSIVMFYSPYCVFSARAAPHFNALARVFPGVKCYAVDAMTNGNLHLRYGLVAVPNVMLFHKGKPIARFNETHLNLERLVTFVEKYTGLQYNGTLNVTSADMSGPVPSTLSKKVDYVLILAWIFTICCLCYGFSKSTLCHKIIETVKRTWQEAEAQHEHEE